MKKKVCLISLFVLLLIINIFNIAGINEDSITGKVITGDASQNVGLNISVIAYIPPLTINSPKNDTYLTNETLFLNYLVQNEQTIWYNLDNSANITITSLTYFNTSIGSHILYLYTNNSLGEIVSETVSFFINLTRFIIIDNEFETGTVDDTLRKQKKGESTDFFDYSYIELQNLSDVILDNPNNGKIKFNEPINLTDDANFTDNQLDLDSNINISFNRIELNATALPNFNKPATLEIYNLTFTTPRILKDGVVCPLSICTQESYTGRALKTLRFNVTEFSIYTTIETPIDEIYEEVPAPLGIVGGGGKVPERDFSIDQTTIKVLLKQGESFKTSINIKNTEEVVQYFTLLLNPSLDGLVSLSEETLTLQPGEEKIVYLNFISTKETLPNVYTGNLKIKTQSKTKEVPIIYNIKSEMVLFEVSLDMLAKYKERLAGEELVLQLTLISLGDFGKTNVSMIYLIKDFEGNIMLEQEEIVEVETQVSFSKTINLPSTISSGDYLVIAQATYENSLSSSSVIFNVKELEIARLINNRYFTFIVILIAVLILLFIVLFLSKYKRKERIYKRKKKKVQKKQVRPRQTIKVRETFGGKLYALEKAFKEGYIKRSSYLSGKERIKKANK